MAMPLAEALGEVERAANEHWKARARACLRWLCATRDEWTTDDFWLAMREHAPDAVTHEPRALGPLIRSVVHDGLAVREPGRWVESVRPESHKSTLFVYRSTGRDSQL